MDTKRIVESLPAHSSHSVLWFDFCDDSKYLISQSRDGTVKFWVKADNTWVEDGELT